MPQLAEPVQSGDNSDIDEHLRNFGDDAPHTNVRRPSTGPDPDFLDNGGGQAGGRELPVSPSVAHGGDTHGGGRGARRAAARDDHNAASAAGSGKSFDPKSAAINKAADKLPGGKKDADGNPVEKGKAEKAVDKAAGKSAEAALVATGVGTTVAEPVGKAVEKVGVRRWVKLFGIGAGIALVVISIPFLIFTYVATHPWEAAKQVLTNSSIRRFALNAAKQAGTSTSGSIIKGITGKLSYETDYRPGVAIAASGQRPEEGTLLSVISKIDFEKSKNHYKQANCPYDVVTQKVVAFDGKQRSVIAKVVDKSGATADINDVEVFNCVLQHYPVIEAMMRSPEARKINKQMNVNLSYAEKKDSDALKGKSAAEVKTALHKKTTDRVWRNAKDSKGLLYPDSCQKDYKPTGDKADKAIKEIANDLLCGKKPEEIKVDYPVENLVADLSKQTTKQKIDQAEVICVFYKKLNADPEAAKKQRSDRAKSSARAGLEALTLADTGVAGDIQTSELNNDFYKLSNFASSRAYNQEINSSSTGTQMDPEAIPTRAIGLTKAYFDSLSSKKRVAGSGQLLNLGEECDNFEKTKPTTLTDSVLNIINLSTIAKGQIARENKDFYGGVSADLVTTNDLIIRTIKLTSNVSNSGAETGSDNFNRMTVGAKNTMYAYTSSLLGGAYQDDTEAAKDSVALETIKRNEDKHSSIASRLFNASNPRSLASRIFAGSTATPKQITENTTQYAINLLNPIKAFADLNTELAFVGYGENNKAMAAVDDDRQYWKIDTTGTNTGVDALANAKVIEGMKKGGQNADKFSAWDKCMETYYPDKQSVIDSGDKNCIELFASGSGLTLARRYAVYKGNMNMFTAWAKLSSDEQDDSMYAKGENSSGFGNGGTVGAGGTDTGPIAGLIYPPNLAGPISGTNYYRMPESQPPGLYVFSGNDRCGSKEITAVLYTVAKKWKETYPNSTLRIGDINAASGHLSHKNGVDVDVTVSDRSAANTGGSRDKSIQLGKWFIDTGIIKMIFYNDTTVQQAVNDYAKSVGKSGYMRSWPGHENHFHVRILDQYKLPTSLGCPR